MARAQLSGDVHFHVEIAALHQPCRDLVARGSRRGAAHCGHHADRGAKHHRYDCPRDGTPASHLDCVYSFTLGSFSAICSPAFTPLATMILSPLFLPTSMLRSSNSVPRQT